MKRKTKRILVVVVKWRYRATGLLDRKKRPVLHERALGIAVFFFISAFCSYFIFLNFQAYLSLRNSRLPSRKLFLTSENSCKEYFVERKQIKSTTATYLLQTSNVWPQNLSSLNHITTYQFLACTRLGATDVIFSLIFLEFRNRNAPKNAKREGRTDRCLRADVSYFLCCTRKRDVCVTPSLQCSSVPLGSQDLGNMLW